MPAPLTPIEAQLQTFDDDGNPWHPTEDPCDDEPNASFFRRLTDTVSCKFRELTDGMQSRPYLAIGVGLGVGFAAGMIHARIAART